MSATARARPLLLAAVCAAVAAASPAPAAAATTGCGNTIDVGPTGFDPSDAVGVRATGVSCRIARGLASRASGRASADADMISGYSCSSSSRSDGFSNFVCTRDARNVAWVLGNAERKCGTVAVQGWGRRVKVSAQGIACALARRYERASHYPRGWMFAIDQFDGSEHAIRRGGRRARIVLRQA